MELTGQDSIVFVSAGGNSVVSVATVTVVKEREAVLEGQEQLLQLAAKEIVLELAPFDGGEKEVSTGWVWEMALASPKVLEFVNEQGSAKESQYSTVSVTVEGEIALKE